MDTNVFEEWFTNHTSVSLSWFGEGVVDFLDSYRKNTTLWISIGTSDSKVEDWVDNSYEDRIVGLKETVGNYASCPYRYAWTLGSTSCGPFSILIGCVTSVGVRAAIATRWSAERGGSWLTSLKEADRVGAV